MEILTIICSIIGAITLTMFFLISFLYTFDQILQFAFIKIEPIPKDYFGSRISYWLNKIEKNEIK